MNLFGKKFLLFVLIVLVCVMEINGKPRRRRHVEDSSESKQKSSEKSPKKKDHDSKSSSHSHESSHESHESHEDSHEHHSGNCSCGITTKTTTKATSKPTTKLPFTSTSKTTVKTTSKPTTKLPSTVTTKSTPRTTQPSHNEPHPVGTTSVKPSDEPKISTTPSPESSTIKHSTSNPSSATTTEENNASTPEASTFAPSKSTSQAPSVKPNATSTTALPHHTDQPSTQQPSQPSEKPIHSTTPQFESSSMEPSTVKPTITPMQCPANSHHTNCFSKCAPTCESFISPYPTINGSQNDPGAPHFCIEDDDCHVGCQCDDGYLADYVNGQLKCVKYKECGCRDENNNYHNQNDTWFGKNCSQIITCINANQTSTKNATCPGGQTCYKNDKNGYYCGVVSTTALPPTTTKANEITTPKPEASTSAPSKSTSQVPSVKPNVTSTTRLPHHTDQPSTQQPSQSSEKPIHSTTPQFENSSPQHSTEKPTMMPTTEGTKISTSSVAPSKSTKPAESSSTTELPHHSDQPSTQRPLSTVKTTVVPSTIVPKTEATTDEPIRTTQRPSSKSPSTSHPSTGTPDMPSRSTAEPNKETTTMPPTIRPNVTADPSTRIPDQHSTKISEKTTTSPGQCPTHSHYSNCTSSCAQKCYTVPKNPHHALGVMKKVPCDVCLDGCACNDGYVINATATKFECIRKEECGCFDNSGLLHPGNDTWLNDNCTQTFTCSNGSLIITPHQCKPNEQCVKKNDFKTYCKSILTTTHETFTTKHFTDSEPTTTEKFNFQPKNVSTNAPIVSTTESSRTDATTQKHVTNPSTKSSTESSTTKSQEKTTTTKINESTTPESNVSVTTSKPSEHLTTKPSTINPNTEEPQTKRTTELFTTKSPSKSTASSVFPGQHSTTKLSASSTTTEPKHYSENPTTKINDNNTTIEPSTTKKSDVTSTNVVTTTVQPEKSTDVPTKNSSEMPSTVKPTPTPMQCPTNSHHTNCFSKCAPTCESFISPYPTINGSQNDPGAPHFCIEDDDCHVGCQCDDGYLADYVNGQLKCVKYKVCGCRDENNNYHNQNDTWFGKNCSQIITCINANQTSTKNATCPNNQECLIDEKGNSYCETRKTTTIPIVTQSSTAQPSTAKLAPITTPEPVTKHQSTHSSTPDDDGPTTKHFTLSTAQPKNSSTSESPIYECIQKCYLRHG